MTIARSLKRSAVGCGLAALAACQTAPPPPVVVPAAFRPLGVAAPYLLGDVIGGHKARAAKMRAAKIRPLGAYEGPAYMADLGAELAEAGCVCGHAGDLALPPFRGKVAGEA